MTIWQVSREMSPLAEAGGIKDVVYGLSRALVKKGHRVTVVLPLYRFLEKEITGPPVISFPLRGDFDDEISFYSVNIDGIEVLLVKARCFEKDRVYTYSRREESLDPDFQYGNGHKDSHKMNLTLQYAAIEGAMALGTIPDLFHLHDGHSGFLPAIIRTINRYKSYFEKTGTLLTIHNAGLIYQQNIENFHEARRLTGLSPSLLKKIQTPQGYNPLVCAGMFGHISTVSERYADDLLSGRDTSSGELGNRLSALEIPLIGITNGIDSVQHDRCFYSQVLTSGCFKDFEEKKKKCRSVLWQRISSLKNKSLFYGNIINDGKPLFTLQSRITSQKGINVLIEYFEQFESETKAMFLVLGEGERSLENKLAKLAGNKNNLVYCRFYDPSLSADVFAGGDFFLIPSLWEPCGLTDFIAQLNGNIPIVHETGGLVKTKDRINGFSYSPNTAEMLSRKIDEAVYLYNEKRVLLHRMRKDAVNMINDKYTWSKVLDKRYLPLYRSIMETKGSS